MLICSLDRFCQRRDMMHPIWRDFFIVMKIHVFLDVYGERRLALTCVVIIVDRAELSLAATCLRLGIYDRLSSYSVRTPPVAVQ